MDLPRTLYADDVLANRRYLKAMLEKLGLETDIAEDGLQALALWKQTRHALVLLDINMPGLSGPEVSTAIREEQRADEAITILGITADMTEEQRQDLIAAGMDDCINKPTSVEELNEGLSPWLAEGNEASSISSQSQEDAHRHILQGDSTLIEQLMTELPKDAGLLEEAFANNDRDAARSIAHQISGVAAMYRLPKLSQAVQVLQAHLNAEESLDSSQLEAVTAALATDLVDLQDLL